MTADFSARLRAARLARSLTQVQLAEAMGLAQTTISGLETADQPPESIALLARFCEVLQTTPNALLGYEQEPEGVAPGWWVVDEAEFERLKAGGRRAKGEEWAFPVPSRYRLAHSVHFAKLQRELEEAISRKKRR